MIPLRPWKFRARTAENAGLLPAVRGGQSRLRRPAGALLAAGLVAGLLAACDGSPETADASARPMERTGAVMVRVDVPPDTQPASLSMLAFRASFSGVSAHEVLGLVDPLSVTSPQQGCELRDVGQASATMASHGDIIDLEEWSGLSLSVPSDPAATAMQAAPRLYPDVTAAIGGVVSELGPLGMVSLPKQLRLSSSEAESGMTGGAVVLGVPEVSRLISVNAVAPRTGAMLDGRSDLTLTLATGAGGATAVELRPLGATVALSCAVPSVPVSQPAMDATVGAPEPDAVLVIPRATLARLVAASGAQPGTRLAAALDTVRRTDETLASPNQRVVVEVRTSVLVEISP